MAEDNIICREIDDFRSDPKAFTAVIDIPGKYLYYKDVRDFIVVIAIENGFKFNGMQMFSEAWISSMKGKMRTMGVVYKVLPRQYSFVPDHLDHIHNFILAS